MGGGLHSEMKSVEKGVTPGQPATAHVVQRVSEKIMEDRHMTFDKL
jgi:hypothetical protein